VTVKSYLEVEDLEVYKMLCQLHIGESFDYGSKGDIHSQGWPVDVY
jgi:hypothetical protein